jgi:hypothetical protein
VTASDSALRGRRRATILVAALALTFAVMRVALGVRAEADLDVAGYNIHHLFTGLLILTACGLPLLLRSPSHRVDNLLTAGFGLGLGLALDEWVYLIATDGSNASYLLPVSFWGALVVVGAALVTSQYSAGRQRQKERRSLPPDRSSSACRSEYE